MAEKRMLSKSFLHDSKFMTMPDSAQVLYVYLNVNADDDGIVDLYSMIKVLGTPEDCVRLLQAKGYIVPINDYLAFLPDYSDEVQSNEEPLALESKRQKVVDLMDKLNESGLDELLRQLILLSKIDEFKRKNG